MQLFFLHSCLLLWFPRCSKKMCPINWHKRSTRSTGLCNKNIEVSNLILRYPFWSQPSRQVRMSRDNRSVGSSEPIVTTRGMWSSHEWPFCDPLGYAVLASAKKDRELSMMTMHFWSRVRITSQPLRALSNVTPGQVFHVSLVRY